MRVYDAVQEWVGLLDYYIKVAGIVRGSYAVEHFWALRRGAICEKAMAVAKNAEAYRKTSRALLNHLGSDSLTIEAAVGMRLRCAHCMASQKSGKETPMALPWGKLAECSKCRERTYCSKACQVADWPDHKSLCMSLREKMRPL